MKRWIRWWLSRKQEENDLAEELRAHMKIEERQRVEAGESPGEAARAARRVFGNAARIQEDIRETWDGPLSNGLSRICATACECCARLRPGRRLSA